MYKTNFIEPRKVYNINYNINNNWSGAWQRALSDDMQFGTRIILDRKRDNDLW